MVSEIRQQTGGFQELLLKGELVLGEENGNAKKN